MVIEELSFFLETAPHVYRNVYHTEHRSKQKILQLISQRSVDKDGMVLPARVMEAEARWTTRPDDGGDYQRHLTTRRMGLRVYAKSL